MTSPAAPGPRAAGCLSNLVLDEILSGGGSPAARAHLAGCAACGARLAAFGGVVPPPPSLELRAELARGDRRRSLGRRAAGALTLAAGAAAALALVLVGRRSDDGGAGAGGERTKGGAALTVIVARASGAYERVTGEGALRAGEEMRFSLATSAAAGPRHAVVLGLDEAGAVTLYVPSGGGAGGAPAPVRAAGVTELPGSIVADDTAGDERVFAVVCGGAAPPDPAAIRRQALAALAAARGRPRAVPSLGTGCVETSVLLHKQPAAQP